MLFFISVIFVMINFQTVISNPVIKSDLYYSYNQISINRIDNINSLNYNNLYYHDGGWNYDDFTGKWCIDFPALQINSALIWSTEIKDSSIAFLSYETEFSFGTYSKGFVEISSDDGEKWYILDVISGNGGPEKHEFDISYWIGNEILIRFRAWGGDEDYVSSGEWCIWNIKIVGVKDEEPPISKITINGNLEDSGWYSSIVQIEIIATDFGVGMDEIHYILDDNETIIQGDYVSLNIEENGLHNLEFWGVDIAGNIENHHFISTIKIDTDAPYISIIEPKFGLYLFDKKFLNLNNVFIIGSYNILVEADDHKGSGISIIKFYLDDTLFSESTEPPYNIYCSEKSFGKKILNIVAIDKANHITTDSILIYYFNF